MTNLVLYRYTEKEKELLFSSLVCLVDTREQQNTHILSTFEQSGFKWRLKALNSGDYSVMIPANAELSIDRDIYLDKEIIIERKRSLEELSGNLAQGRREFENEFIRANGARKYLVIENADLSQIYKHEYMTGLNEKSFINSLFVLSARYDIKVNFIPKTLTAKLIQTILQCAIKEIFKL